MIGIIINGTLVLKPSILPFNDTSAMVPNSTGPTPPPLMLGVSDSGNPTKIYTFKNYNDAVAALKGGSILSYVARAFNPSPDKDNSPGPSTIKFIRVSSAARQASGAVVAPYGGFG